MTSRVRPRPAAIVYLAARGLAFLTSSSVRLAVMCVAIQLAVICVAIQLEEWPDCVAKPFALQVCYTLCYTEFSGFGRNPAAVLEQKTQRFRWVGGVSWMVWGAFGGIFGWGTRIRT